MGLFAATASGKTIDLLKEAPGLAEKAKAQVSKDSLIHTNDKLEKLIDALTLLSFSVDWSSSASLTKLILDTDSHEITTEVTVKLTAWGKAGGMKIPGTDVDADGRGTVVYNFESGESSDPEFKFEIKAADTKVADFKLPSQLLSKDYDGSLNELLELIPNGGLVKRIIKSDYDEVRDKYYSQYGGEENVYFASRQFVGWASIGTLGEAVFTAFVTGGASVKQSMAKAKTEALKELGNVARWLKNRGVAQIETAARQLLSGEDVTGFTVTLVGQKVVYYSKLEIVGTRVISEFATNPHAAFVLIWNETNVSPFSNTTDQPTKEEPTNPPDERNPNPFFWRMGVRASHTSAGCYILMVDTPSPANSIGLKVGDRIVSVNGKPVGKINSDTVLLNSVLSIEGGATGKVDIKADILIGDAYVSKTFTSVQLDKDQ